MTRVCVYLGRWSATVTAASVRNRGRAAAAGGVPGGDASDVTPADDEREYGMGGLPATCPEHGLDDKLNSLTMVGIQLFFSLGEAGVYADEYHLP